MRNLITRMLLTVAVLCSVSIEAMQGQSNDGAKGNVRYSIKPEYTRFLLFVKGPLTYTRDLRDRTLTVTISDIKSSITTAGWSKAFRTGEIEAAIVDPIENGKTRVVLTLRNGSSRFRITEHDRHEAIWVDVFSQAASVAAIPAGSKQRHEADQSAARKAARFAARVPSKRSIEKSSVSNEPIKTSFVDIAAIARQQMEDSYSPGSIVSKDEQRTTATPQRNVGEVKATGSARKPILWLLLACFSLVLSVAVAGLLSYRVTNRNKTEQQFISVRAAAAAAAPASAVDAGGPERAWSEEREPEVVSSRKAFDDAILQEDVPMLDLAARYNRNQGDIELAMKLRESVRHQVHLSGAKTINPTTLPTRARVSAAKKLGIGKGELDLANKLQRLSMAQSEKDKAA